LELAAKIVPNYMNALWQIVQSYCVI